MSTKRYLGEKDLLAVPFDKGTGIWHKHMHISELNDILNLEQFEKVTVTRKNERDLYLKG